MRLESLTKHWGLGKRKMYLAALESIFDLTYLIGEAVAGGQLLDRVDRFRERLCAPHRSHCPCRVGQLTDELLARPWFSSIASVMGWETLG